jgi:ankyrin repeat protein
LQGFTALHHAASRGHRDVVLVLIEGGADTSLRNGEGKLASVFAVIGGVTDLLPPR